MNIEEKCKNWKLNYNGPDISSLSEEDERVLAYLLHVGGDSVALVAEIKDADVRENIIAALFFLFKELKTNVESAVGDILSFHSLITPLEGNLSENNLYGEDIKNKLLSLVSKEEKDLIIDSFPSEKDINIDFISEEEEEENKDDYE